MYFPLSQPDQRPTDSHGDCGVIGNWVIVTLVSLVLLNYPADMCNILYINDRPAIMLTFYDKRGHNGSCNLYGSKK